MRYERAIFYIFRPRPFSWIQSLLLTAILFLVCGRWQPLKQLSDQVLGVFAFTRSDPVALHVYSVFLIGLIALLFDWVYRWIQATVITRVGSVVFVRATGADELRIDNTTLHIKGVPPAIAKARAMHAIKQWSLTSESISLCPLPVFRLARFPLGYEFCAGMIAVSTWYFGLPTVTLRDPPGVVMTSFVPICGLILIVHSLQWAFGVPFGVGGAYVMPGGIIRHSLWGEKRADPESGQLWVYISNDLVPFHHFVFLPHRGQPWSLGVPGKAIDLVMGAWFAKCAESSELRPTAEDPLFGPSDPDKPNCFGQRGDL